jgi:hypothetical protein
MSKLYVVEGFDGMLIGPFDNVEEALDLIPGSAVRELIDPDEIDLVEDEQDEVCECADDYEEGEVTGDSHDPKTCPVCNDEDDEE